MKKLSAALAVILTVALLLTGCAGNKRRLYVGENLADYVKVGDYNGFELDTASEEYLKSRARCIYEIIRDQNLSDEAIKGYVTLDESADASVELGDLVYVDYKGYNGETLIADTQGKGYFLSVGSDSFVDDFENQLLNARVGDTVNVSVTFPGDYSVTRLAGAKANFTVKINGIAKAPQQLCKALSIESEQKCDDYLREAALKKIILNRLTESSKISGYPEKDIEKMYEATIDFYNENNTDITTLDKEEILNEIVYPLMNVNMIMYYILDAENLEIYESTVESQPVSNPAIAESYAVQDIVLKYLLENAVVK